MLPYNEKPTIRLIVQIVKFSWTYFQVSGKQILDKHEKNAKKHFENSPMQTFLAKTAEDWY